MQFTVKDKQIAGIMNLWNNPKKAVGQMRDKTGGRCCLCVLEDTARYFGFDEMPNDSYSVPVDGCAAFMGIENEEDYGENFYLSDGTTAAIYNDGSVTNLKVREHSHKEIAILLAKKLGYDKLAAELQEKLNL